MTEMSVDGNSLISARRLRSISQAELASRLGMSQPRLSQLEHGTAPVPEELVRDIAAALVLPESFFRLTASTVPRTSLAFRKSARAQKRATDQATEYFVQILRVVEHLLQDTGYPCPNLPFAPPSTTDQFTASEIETYAQQTRRALRLDEDAPIPNLTRSLENAGIVIVPIDLESWSPDDETDYATFGHWGMSYWIGKGAPALIAVFSGASPDRNRFTIAHELGHMVLHRYRDSATPEADADAFASAFLMPMGAATMLPAGLTLSMCQMLKPKWGMSMQAIIMRAAHVGAISVERKASLFKQLSARRWRHSEPGHVQVERPKLLHRLLTNRFGADYVRSEALEEETGLPRLIIRSLALPPSSTAKHQDSPDADVLPFTPADRPVRGLSGAKRPTSWARR